METVGDVYVVVSGAPKTVPDHAKRCAEMALAMMDSVSAIRAEIDAMVSLPDDWTFDIHIGLNSGSDLLCYILFLPSVNAYLILLRCPSFVFDVVAVPIY